MKMRLFRRELAVICFFLSVPVTAWANCAAEQIVKMMDVAIEIEKIQEICGLKEAHCTSEQIVKMKESNVDYERIRRLCGLKESSCTPDQIGRMKDVGIADSKIRQICWESEIKTKVPSEAESTPEIKPAPVSKPITEVEKKAVVPPESKAMPEKNASVEKKARSSPKKQTEKRQQTPYGNVGAARVQENNGVGFGQSLSTAIGLLHLFYDYNLDSRSQIHVQVGRTYTGESESAFRYEVDATRDYAMVSYRLFLSENSGFYFGLGGGISYNRIEYRNTTTNREYKASGKGILALAEIGWQGNTGYYFHVGFQPALYLSYDDDFESSTVAERLRIVNSEDLWEDSKQPSQVSIGFGWFF